MAGKFGHYRRRGGRPIDDGVVVVGADRRRGRPPPVAVVRRFGRQQRIVLAGDRGGRERHAVRSEGEEPAAGGNHRNAALAARGWAGKRGERPLTEVANSTPSDHACVFRKLIAH